MKRYNQQQIVSEIGDIGQIKLKNAKVLIIGAGGLGTPVAAYLTSIGIGTLGIIDGDIIQETNLNRQFLYNENETGKSKITVLEKKLKLQNPHIDITKFEHFLTLENSKKIVTQFDVICDCTDNLETRLLIDQTCSLLNKPLVYAGVKDWEGYVTILNHRSKIRLHNIFSFDSLAKDALTNCSTSGIINTTCGIAGSIQATEVIKIILEQENQLDGEILCFNSKEMVFKKLKLFKN